MIEHATRIQSAFDATPMDQRKELFGERPFGSEKWGRSFTLSDWGTLLLRWSVLDASTDRRKSPLCAYYGADISDVFPQCAASTAMLILGPQRSRTIIYTIHPGLPVVAS